jgi:hypothetical protein
VSLPHTCTWRRWRRSEDSQTRRGRPSEERNRVLARRGNGTPLRASGIIPKNLPVKACVCLVRKRKSIDYTSLDCMWGALGGVLAVRAGCVRDVPSVLLVNGSVLQ